MTGDLSSLGKLRRLKDVNLYHCNRIYGNVASIGTLPDLEVINLGGCHKVHATDLEVLVSLGHLKQFSFERCPRVCSKLRYMGG